MTRPEVLSFMETLSSDSPGIPIKLIETHISWVILTEFKAYKIKKPVQFNFLDFSTLGHRKSACEQEVILNKRLAPHMYLDCVPIIIEDDFIKVGSEGGQILDFAVLMNRMDDSLQMDLLLEQARVKEEDIIELAEVLISFHRYATVIEEGEDWKELHAEFEDIMTVLFYVEDWFGSDEKEVIEKSIHYSYAFLESIQQRIIERNQAGFVIDGHGDLHTRNILLTKPPTIFDCIEFNDDFRKLDLLSEIGFLCMDLERFGRKDFADLFLKIYLNEIICIENETDQKLFTYYKLYRANVMIKIHCIRAAKTTPGDQDWHYLIKSIQQYFSVFRKYLDELEASFLI